MMWNQSKFTNLIAIALIWVAVDCQQERPCDEFVWVKKDEGLIVKQGLSWTGAVSLNSPFTVLGYYVDLFFDQQVILETSDWNDWFLLTSRDNRTFQLNYSNQEILKNDALVIFLKVRYWNERQVPFIREIRFNGVKICPNDTATSTTMVTRSIHNHNSNNNINNNNFTPTRTTSTQRSINPNSNNRPQFGDSDDDLFREIPANNRDVTTQTRRPSTVRVTERTTTTVRPITTKQTESPFFQGDLSIFAPTERRFTSPATQQIACGTVIPRPNPLVIHGEKTYKGQFPWHVALYISERIQLKYTCGGNLINKRTVLTAAHCVAIRGSANAIDPEHLLVYLGKYHLQQWSDTKDVKVSEILVHPDFNHSRFTTDIAILKLKTDVTFTDLIRPICLWPFDVDLSKVVRRSGQVPGWGYNEYGVISEELSYAHMPIVSFQTCILSNPEFFSRVTSNTTFCAGFDNGGTNVCNGDSGGGLVLKENGRWYLRGIVSVSIALQNHFLCDPDHYAVFTDVAKHKQWIEDNM